MSIYLGSSEPSKIYVGSSEVSAVFVGTEKVRPVWKYSYDFRNKTLAQIQSDGWSVYRGTPVLDSYGFSGSSGTAGVKKNIDNSIFTNAKKITIEYSYSLNRASDCSFLIAQSVTSSSTVGNTGGYSTTGDYFQIQIYGTIIKPRSSISSGTYTYNLVLDLSNKTYSANLTGRSAQTGTLTDTQISNIKNNLQVLKVSATNTGSCGVKNFYIKVE